MEAIDNDYPDYLDDPLVVSGGRDGWIRIASINTGHEEVPQIRAHDDQINSIAIFSGYSDRQVLPFFVTGSDDHRVRVWSLVDLSMMHNFEGHVFDVTYVEIYMPRGSSAKHSGGGGGGGGPKRRTSQNDESLQNLSGICLYVIGVCT
ncbi:hypothetical protein B484DRAFT_244167 [Ochromonadaceae sp. CCMP2298]|nr:hypothetical protein B484DRAFT_244167 [Ochromonadaceae sp. CCMP2298]